jgi:hypothetical protein
MPLKHLMEKDAVEEAADAKTERKSCPFKTTRKPIFS